MAGMFDSKIDEGHTLRNSCKIAYAQVGCARKASARSTVHEDLHHTASRWLELYISASVPSMCSCGIAAFIQEALKGVKVAKWKWVL